MPAKPPDGYSDCDKAPDPQRCRDIFEGTWCARNPSDPWCSEQRAQRSKIRQAKGIAILVGLGLVWWHGRSSRR